MKDLSRHLLRRDFPLSPTRADVILDPSVLDRYAGRYRPRKDLVLDVRREGGRLTIGFPAMSRLTMRAQNERDFFVPELGFEFRFPSNEPLREMLFRPNAASPMMPVPRVF